MSEGNNHLPPRAASGDDRLNEGGLRAPPELGAWGKLWWWFHFLILVKLARLRFVAVLAAIGAVILYWDTLLAYYDKWTRPAAAQSVAAADVEYFCPMHPQVVTADPKEKCPICFMNLSKRKKGEANKQEALPAGVVQRLQLSPYRIVLAGIQTWDVKYLPLRKEIATVGTVEFDERSRRSIAMNVKGRIDKLFVNVTGAIVNQGDALASIYSPEISSTVQNLLDTPAGARESARQRLRLWGVGDEQIREIERAGKPVTHITLRSPIHGHVIKKYQVEGEWVDETARLFDIADLSTVWIEAQVYENEAGYLKTGLPVRATTESLPNREFKGTVAFVHPHLDQSSRTLKVRINMGNPDHEARPEVSLRPGMYAAVTITVPPSELAQQFLMKDGNVLAVPESAVIHTGSQKIVYREEAPGVYDAVGVEVGTPITGPGDTTFYPVVKGLAAGEKVVTVGSYLLDAETKVSAAAGSIYFGGGGGGSKGGSSTVAGVRPTTPEDEEFKAKAGLSKLSTVDRKLAEEQQFCPILKANRLGSMGSPPKVVLKDQPVFLCCKECEDRARANPEQTLETVKRFKHPDVPKTATTAAVTLPPPTKLTPEKEAKVKAALAQLGEEDRRLADEQQYCAVEPENRLGSMGVPVKVLVNGQSALLCCKGCVDEAKAQPERTLATLELLKARAKAEKGKP